MTSLGRHKPALPNNSTSMTKAQQQSAFTDFCARGDGDLNDGRAPFSIGSSADRSQASKQSSLLARKKHRVQGMNRAQQEEIFQSGLREQPAPFDPEPVRLELREKQKKTREYEDDIAKKERARLQFNERAFAYSPKHGARAGRQIKKYSAEQLQLLQKKKELKQLSFNARVTSGQNTQEEGVASWVNGEAVLGPKVKAVVANRKDNILPIRGKVGEVVRLLTGLSAKHDLREEQHAKIFRIKKFMDAQPAYYVVKKEDKSKRELGPFRAAELETQRVLQGVDYEYLQSLHGVQKEKVSRLERKKAELEAERQQKEIEDHKQFSSKDFHRQRGTGKIKRSGSASPETSQALVPAAASPAASPKKSLLESGSPKGSLRLPKTALA